MRSGFTLVEMLVVLSITMLLTTVSVSNFRASEKNEFLRFSARQLADSIQSIQSSALGGTQSKFSLAKSYGVHIDKDAQDIRIFADINTTTSGLGRWDGDIADANNRRDELMEGVKKIDVGKRGAVVLNTMEVAYTYQSGDCPDTKNVKGYCVKQVASLDIAAVPPSARILVNGGVDFPTDPSGNPVVVQSVTFTLRQTQTGKDTDVVVYTLSGRIDVEY